MADILSIVVAVFGVALVSGALLSGLMMALHQLRQPQLPEAHVIEFENQPMARKVHRRSEKTPVSQVQTEKFGSVISFGYVPAPQQPMSVDYEGDLKNQPSFKGRFEREQRDNQTVEESSKQAAENPDAESYDPPFFRRGFKPAAGLTHGPRVTLETIWTFPR